MRDMIESSRTCKTVILKAKNYVTRGRAEVGDVGRGVLQKPSVILCLVGKSLHNDNNVSAFRRRLKLNLSFVRYY